MRRTLLLFLLLAPVVRADDGLRLDWTRESLTATWRHYTQVVDGLEVVDGGVIERVERDGTVHETFRELVAPQPRVPRRRVTSAEVTSALPAGVVTERKLVALNDHGVARPVWRVIVETTLHEPYAHYVDASTGELLRSEPLFSRVQARVFDINPVAKLNRPDLRDQNNAAAAVPSEAYSLVELDNLQPSGALAGPFVAIVNLDDPVPTPADASQPLLFDRSQPQFEEVNAYYHLDHAQKYLISLGYSGTRRLVNYVLPCDPHALHGNDNSYYLRAFIPGQGQLLFGDGGVDDAEDSDILLHEFGHVIQDWIAPATFTGPSSTPPPAIGEGFADYWAFSQTYSATVAAGRDPFCIADWDPRCAGDNASEGCSYPAGSDCLRRVDGTKTVADYVNSNNSGTEHQNGEIWSSALREIFMSLTTRLGVDAGKRMADSTILEGTFGTPPNPTYATMARKLLAADAELNGGVNQQVICSAMMTRGILAAADCSLSPHGELTVIPPTNSGGAIPDNTTAGLTLRATVSDPRSIDKLYVDVDIQHTSRGDLSLLLVGPDGTSAYLQQPSLDRAPNVRATFGLDAPTVDSLAVFHGRPAAGEWKLIVQDLRPHDSGSVRSWSLRIQFVGDTPQTARPASLAPRRFIAAVARATGANGTNFVSDVYLVNRSATLSQASLVFTPSGQSGWTTFAAVKIQLAPHQAAILSDIVGHTMETSGTGNLDIVGDTSALLVTSRTYTSSASGGSYGQSIPSVSTIDANVIGGTSYRGTVAGLRNDADYRTNLGISELAGGSGVVHLTYFDVAGSTINESDIPLMPFEHRQTLVPFANAARAELYVVSGDARPIAYASVVDNRSGDAVYLQAETRDTTVYEIPPPLTPLPQVIPVIRSEGVNGTVWRSDVTVANLLTQPATFPVRLGADGAVQSIQLTAGQTLRVEDVLKTQFNVTGGLALLSYLKTPGLFVTSRTWTDSAGGSYGVGIPPISVLGGTVPGIPVILAHLENTAAFRSNVGLIEVRGAPATVRVIVYDPAGSELARRDVALGANAITQLSLSELLGREVYGAWASAEIVSETGHAFAYVSIVDNSTGDSVFIDAQ